MQPIKAIDTFNKTLLLPLYEEIQNSARMKSKGRTIEILSGAKTIDPIADEAIATAHGKRRHVEDLKGTPIEEQRGEWIGHTLVIIEREDLRAPYPNKHAGRFYASALFRLEGGAHVFVSPWVFYWMRFNNKIHAFAHRYNTAYADYPIESASRADMVNHALDSITGFDTLAFQPTKPF